jgi:predicted dehydrogenase
MSQLRGAVIGAGYFGQFHYDAWSRIDAVDIVACCDIDAEKAQTTATQYGIPHVYSDYRSLLDQQQLDFVDIVTRPDTHLPIGREVADRRLHMICQKPLAPTLEEARQLVELAQNAGVCFMVHENFRFQPWYREIKRLLDNDTIGSQLHTVSFRNRAGDGWGPDAYLARQPYFQTMAKFLIYEAGIHTIDTFRYLAGEIARCWCVLRKLNSVIAGEDAALAVFEFEAGALGLYDANRFNESTADEPRYTFGELLVEADGGTIRLYDDGRLTIQSLGEQEREHPYERSKRGFASDSVLFTQQHFVAGLQSGGSFETDGPSYLRNIAVQEALYRSSTSGQWESP